MIFTWEGQTYDTSDMTAYETGMPSMPTIYQTADGLVVFVVTVDRWKGVQVHRADAYEIRSLAARFGIKALLKAAPETPPAGP